MKRLILVAALSVAPAAVAQVPAPPPVEARLSALEAKVAALEAKCANCCCNAPQAKAAPVAAPAQYVQSCANGVCQMVPVQSAQAAPVFGDCSSGQCSGGSCASGNCGGGRRGLFRRR